MSRESEMQESREATDAVETTVGELPQRVVEILKAQPLNPYRHPDIRVLPRHDDYDPNGR